jgi:phosphosulfolactate phosphohydrolase-like enzyme
MIDDFIVADAIENRVRERKDHDAAHARAARRRACIRMLYQQVYHLLDARLDVPCALRISLLDVVKHPVYLLGGRKRETQPPHR